MTGPAVRITVVGTVPDQDLAAALARWLVPAPVDGHPSVAVKDLLTGDSVAAGDPLPLSPWDVRVLVSTDDHGSRS